MYVRYLLLIVMVVGLSVPQVRHYIMPAASMAVYPVVVVQNWIYAACKPIADTLQTHASLQRDLAWYRDMYEWTRAENVRLASTLSYANAVDEVAAFTKRYDADYGVTAGIIFRQCTPEQHTCLIDAGSNRGITPDMIAVYHNMLVGRVEEVYPYYSRIRLVTDAGCHVPIECVQTGTRGIHQGSNSVEYSQLLYVSHLADIQIGDTVITRSSGVVYPYGFGVGRVTSYETHDLYHTVYVQPFINIRDIEYCSIIQPGAEFTVNSSRS